MFISSKKINVIFDISRSYNAISSNSGMAGVFNYEVNILTNIIKHHIYNIYLTAECDESYFRNKVCKRIKQYSRCKFINKNNLESIIKNIDAYVSFSLKIPQIIINYNIKNYLVIHDLLPLLHPDYYSSSKQKQLEAANFGKTIYDSINCDTTIITISENSKNDIEKYIIKNKQNKVINLSSGINKNKFFKIKHIANKYYKKYSFLNKKYILSVSNIRPYKNMIFLVNSFINFIDKYKISDLYLVLCGEFGEDIDKLFDNINKNKSYKDKIIITGFIPEKDINIIYNKAFCFVFPSLFEGFGLPVLEAIQCNIPVISSNLTSLPEIYGEAGIGFNPIDEIELMNALHAIYYNENIRKLLIKNCNIQKNKFSINRTAKNYINIIQNDYKEKNMNDIKNAVNNIVWYIPIKKLRNSVRIILYKLIYNMDKINNLENKIEDLNIKIESLSIIKELLLKNMPENEKINIESQYAFTKIYKTNYLGSKESFSGQGSELKSTETLRNRLVDIVKNYNIKSVLDIPCGDFNWMKEIVNNFESYTGGDIVSEIIELNNNKYSNENIKFKVLNLCSDKLDKSDLIFTRDCLQHLPLDYVIKAINNIKNSGSKYLIASSIPYIEDNLTNDITLGDCRYLNLEKPPFNFPKPILMIKEDNQDTATDKYMGMWEISEL